MKLPKVIEEHSNSISLFMYNVSLIIKHDKIILTILVKIAVISRKCCDFVIFTTNVGNFVTNFVKTP